MTDLVTVVEKKSYELEIKVHAAVGSIVYLFRNPAYDVAQGLWEITEIDEARNFFNYSPEDFEDTDDSITVKLMPHKHSEPEETITCPIWVLQDLMNK